MKSGRGGRRSPENLFPRNVDSNPVLFTRYHPDGEGSAQPAGPCLTPAPHAEPGAWATSAPGTAPHSRNVDRNDDLEACRHDLHAGTWRGERLAARRGPRRSRSPRSLGRRLTRRSLPSLRSPPVLLRAQYVNTASACVRKGLKESLRAKAAQRGNVNFNVVTFEGGNPGPKGTFTGAAAAVRGAASAARRPRQMIRRQRRR